MLCGYIRGWVGGSFLLCIPLFAPVIAITLPSNCTFFTGSDDDDDDELEAIVTSIYTQLSSSSFFSSLDYFKQAKKKSSIDKNKIKACYLFVCDEPNVNHFLPHSSPFLFIHFLHLPPTPSSTHTHNRTPQEHPPHNFGSSRACTHAS